MADRLRAEVPFPAAGEGIALKFSNSGCAELQKRFGAEWFTAAHTRLNTFDPDFIKACIEIGATKGGKPAKVEFDAIDIPMMQIAETVLDALYVCVHGMTFSEYLIELGKRAEALEASGNPTNVSSPENTSLS
jgi:hypothetical protein